MEKLRAFLKRKDIVFSAKRYFIDAMGAMAQGLFCTLLVGTILNTIGQQFHIGVPERRHRHHWQGRRRGALHHRRAVLGHGRPWYGGGHRPGAERAAAGAVLTDPRGFCHQLHGRRGRPSGGAVRGHCCRGAGQGRQQGDEDRHSGDAHRHRAGGRGLRRADRRAGGHGGLRRGTGHHVGNGATALLHGYSWCPSSSASP